MKCKLLLIFAVVVTASLLSACGRNRHDDNEQEQLEQQELSLPYTSYVIVDDEPLVRTLTVHTNNRHTAVLRQAATAMNSSWQEQGIPYEFRLEVDDHNWLDFDELDSRWERLRVELMAGQGPDIVYFSELQDMRVLAGSGLVVDFYSLMDADPRTNREDFFTEALSAFEFNGGLFMFPISFGFYHVGINANIPQPFIDRFTQYSTISVSQLMDIYLDFKTTHFGEFAHLRPGVAGDIGRDHHSTLQTIMSGFIDLDAHTNNLLDPGFSAFLNTISQVFENHEFISSGWVATPFGSDQFMRERAMEQVFDMCSNMLTPVNAFFQRENPHFVHYVPLTDDQGRLVINASGRNVWASLCVTAVGDSALAWEFIQYLIHAYASPGEAAMTVPRGHMPNPWANHSLASPILRSLSEDFIRQSFHTALNRHSNNHADGFNFLGVDTLEEREQQINIAVDRIAAYNERPMSLLSLMIPDFLFAERLDDFMLGIITADTAARHMYNAVSLWLIE